MGRIIEQEIATIFGGVSRQPASVRRPNQVEVMNNALPSVVTGGFEKRPATQHLKYMNYIPAGNTYAVHAIDRDSTEQTFLMVNADGITAVNAITGAELTVNIGDSTKYYLVEQDAINATGIVQIGGANMSVFTQFESETAFDWAWSTSDATTGRFKVQGSVDGTTWVDIQAATGGAASGTFSTTIAAVGTGDHNFIRINITTGFATADDFLTVKAVFKDTTYLASADPDDLRFATVADTTFVANRLITTRMAEAGTGTVTASYQDFAAAEAAVTLAGDGRVFKILGNDVDGFGSFYVIDDPISSLFKETFDPTAHNAFDPSSMPHTVSRETDGTYTFAGAVWVDRPVGDEVIVEAPPFIGSVIQDVSFYRNRLALVADEHVFTSREGHVYTLWPEKAVDVLDTDPVARSATSTDINILKFATVFRKIMFTTSERAQFELSSSGAFTPTTALFDLATSYAASPIAKPKAVGDVLYFPAKTESHAIFYEYFFDDTSLSNTAADVSKHVVDYIPNDILDIVGDPATNTLFVLTTGEQNNLFMYRTFFDGNEKMQSAWSKYTFGATESDAFIHGIAVMSGFLVMIVERQDGGVYLEQAPIERETQNATVGFSPYLDQREVVTGTYNVANNCTYWNTSYEHSDDAEIILGPSHTEPGRQPEAFYPDRYVSTLASVTAGQTYIVDGLTFTAHATTTTVANREFSIAGTDAQDAAQLVVVLNDATYGMTNATATDLTGGLVQIDIDAKATAIGSLATPTGTAVSTNTALTVTTADIVAAVGDLDTHSVWIGRPYTMQVTLSELFARGQKDQAIISGRLQLRDITFLVSDTGYLKVTVSPRARTDQVYTFEGKTLGELSTTVGSASIAPTATVRVPIWTESTHAVIAITNNQPVPSVVESASWRGFFNEITRQE